MTIFKRTFSIRTKTTESGWRLQIVNFSVREKKKIFLLFHTTQKLTCTCSTPDVDNCRTKVLVRTLGGLEDGGGLPAGQLHTTSSFCRTHGDRGPVPEKYIGVDLGVMNINFISYRNPT